MTPRHQPHPSADLHRELMEKAKAERKPMFSLPPGYRLMTSAELHRTSRTFGHPVTLLEAATKQLYHATVLAHVPGILGQRGPRVRVETAHGHAVIDLVPERARQEPVDDIYPGACTGEERPDPPQWDEGHEFIAVMRTDVEQEEDGPNSPVAALLRMSIALAERDREITRLRDRVAVLEMHAGILPIGTRRVS